LVPESQLAAQNKLKESIGEETEFVVVLRTGRIWEVEMVAEAFKKAKIPCYEQLETSSGLRLAKEIPQAMGPGDWWAFYVPKRIQKTAEEVLAELPIEVTVNPDIWHFSPSGEGKRFFKAYAWYTLIALAIGFIFFIIGLFYK